MKNINMVILICLLALVLFGCRKNSTPSSLPEETTTTEEPTTQTTVFDDAPEPYTFHEFKDSIQKAKDKNSDAVGWVFVRNTKIDYPVYQSTDNDFYLKRNPRKVKDIHGSIFADYRCKFNELSQNTVLFGHNMLNGSMFGSQKKYTDKTFLETNPIIEFSTSEKDRQWKIFAVYFTEPTLNYFEPNPTREHFQDIVRIAKERSLFKINNVDVLDDDHILTLSTCAPGSMGDKRFVVVARLLRDGEGHSLQFDS